MSCQEGEDASLLNNMNELIITGVNKGNFEFDHLSTEMITHLYNNSEFSGVPENRMSHLFAKNNDQDSLVAVNQISVNYIDIVAPGDYYAYSFIDLNANSEVDVNEPYEEWLDDQGNRKVIPVKEESRWVLLFEFEETYSQ
jgi:hypothetical protein